MIIANPSTLDELRADLAEAEAAWDTCKFIDDWGLVLKCRAECQREIDRLRAEIARLESEDDERTDRTARLWPTGEGDGD
jgi:hypothetical protein